MKNIFLILTLLVFSGIGVAQTVTPTNGTGGSFSAGCYHIASTASYPTTQLSLTVTVAPLVNGSFCITGWTGGLPTVLGLQSTTNDAQIYGTDYTITGSGSSFTVNTSFTIPTGGVLIFWNNFGIAAGPLTGQTPSSYTGCTGCSQMGTGENFEFGCTATSTSANCNYANQYELIQNPPPSSPDWTNSTTTPAGCAAYHDDGNVNHTHALQVLNASNGYWKWLLYNFNVPPQPSTYEIPELLISWYECTDNDWGYNPEAFELNLQNDPQIIWDNFGANGAPDGPPPHYNTHYTSQLLNIQGVDYSQIGFPVNYYNLSWNYQKPNAVWKQKAIRFKFNTVNHGSCGGSCVVTANVSAYPLITFTRNDGGNWITDGACVVGYEIRMNGFTAPVPTNPAYTDSHYGVYISACTASTITVSDSTGIPVAAPVSGGRGPGYFVNDVSSAGAITWDRSNKNGSYAAWEDGIEISGSDNLDIPGVMASDFSDNPARGWSINLVETYTPAPAGFCTGPNTPAGCTPLAYKYLDDILVVSATSASVSGGSILYGGVKLSGGTKIQ